MHVALQKQGRFRLETRYPHKRSEGLRDDPRLDRLLLAGKRRDFPSHGQEAAPCPSTPSADPASAGDASACTP